MFCKPNLFPLLFKHCVENRVCNNQELPCHKALAHSGDTHLPLRGYTPLTGSSSYSRIIYPDFQSPQLSSLTKDTLIVLKHCFKASVPPNQKKSNAISLRRGLKRSELSLHFLFPTTRREAAEGQQGLASAKRSYERRGSRGPSVTPGNALVQLPPTASGKGTIARARRAGPLEAPREREKLPGRGGRDPAAPREKEQLPRRGGQDPLVPREREQVPGRGGRDARGPSERPLLPRRTEHPAHARWARPSPPPLQPPAAPASHHVPGAQDDGAGADMAAAAAAGAVEAVTTSLERHGGSEQLQPPDPPPALSRQFPTPRAVKPPARASPPHRPINNRESVAGRARVAAATRDRQHCGPITTALGLTPAFTCGGGGRTWAGGGSLSAMFGCAHLCRLPSGGSGGERSCPARLAHGSSSPGLWRARTCSRVPAKTYGESCVV